MTRAQLLLALSSIAGTAAVLPASDCDCPKSTKGASCTCAQDDSGLLDVVDKIAGHLHEGVSKSLPKIGGLSSKKKQPSCGCDACQSGSNVSFSETDVAPSRTHSIVPQGDVPPSLKVPQPVPDSRVDPFVDEPIRSGQNRVRGKTIQYRSNNGTNDPSTSQPNPSSGAAPRTTYGKQYNPQAQRTPATADYWAESGQKTGSLQLIAPASSEVPSLEQVFRPAYRVNLNDTNQQQARTQVQAQTTSRVSSLRAVPSRDSELLGSEERESADPFERQIKPTPVYDNPLRR